MQRLVASCLTCHPLRMRMDCLDRFCLSVLVTVGWGVLGAVAQPPSVLEEFDRPFLFSYGSWQDRIEPADGAVVLQQVNNQGGAGYNVHWNLADRSEHSLALWARVGVENEAKALRVLLRDESGLTAVWDFPLGEMPDETMRLVYPLDGASLAESNSPDEKGALDLARIRQVQVMGDWAGGKTLDLRLEAVFLVSPNAELLAQREAKQRATAEREEAKRQALAEARARVQHTPDGPWVVSVGAAAPDILGLTIQAGTLQRFQPIPYKSQAGDRLAKTDHPVLAWTNGVLDNVPLERVLLRRVANRQQKVGYLIGGRDGPPLLLPSETVTGVMLETLTAEDPDSYRLTSPDDPRLREPLRPLVVYRKSKPNNQAQPNKELTVRHVIYLRLPWALEDGRTYRLELPGLNTREEQVTYEHRSREVRCEAIHVSQVGYRPDDPFKRAFLSLWLGTGGAYTFTGLDRFLLLDHATGRPVYGGAVKQVMAADGTEQLRVKKNYSQTAVYQLDFSEFAEPGEYRVTLPGLGCSEPFPIRPNVWHDAFRTSMKGFLHQRSGIELGPPATDYRRPRNLHPADGLKVFASSVSIPEATAGDGDWFDDLVQGRTETVLTNAWGGYADAGDFDRRYNHLWATYLHLELLDCFPKTCNQWQLSLPPDEAGNALPDLLDEALWNLELFHRLQEPDGGVRGGIESSAHPRPGETSWLESLAVMAYAPDPTTSYLYAACAARASRVMATMDESRAKVFWESAVRAWTWAERHRLDFAQRYGEGARREMRHTSSTAAVELLWLTGQAEYQKAFERESVFRERRPVPVIEQQGALFAYARLPEDRGVSVLKERAREAILATADAAITFAEGNVFGLTTEIPQLPEIGPVGYFTTPGMISRSCPRAHFLSGESKYLLATVRSCNFSAGANPDNITFTTGVGHHGPQAPLHIDSRMSGQAAPAGLTLYGVSDPARDDQSSAWVHTWVLNGVMVPNSRTWPATEAYVDLYLWPMMNEFTMHQNLGPTSYTWGYLAARE